MQFLDGCYCNENYRAFTQHSPRQLLMESSVLFDNNNVELFKKCSRGKTPFDSSVQWARVFHDIAYKTCFVGILT